MVSRMRFSCVPIEQLRQSDRCDQIEWRRRSLRTLIRGMGKKLAKFYDWAQTFACCPLLPPAATGLRALVLPFIRLDAPEKCAGRFSATMMRTNLVKCASSSDRLRHSP